LKKENESLKVEDMIHLFFAKRHEEEALLNRLETIYSMQIFMHERRE
jgi:hypothetical protein